MPETRTTSSTGGQKGVKLARFDLIPAGPLRELAEHYGRGARKYANHQWRKGYEWSKSIGALGRHFNEFMAGKDYDVCSNDPAGCSFVDADGEAFLPEQPDTCFNHTGSHHMAAVAWHAFLLLEFKDTHPGHDDRYVSNTLEDDDEIRPARVWVGEALWEQAISTMANLWRQEHHAFPARFIAGFDGTLDDQAKTRRAVEGGEERRTPAELINDRLYNLQR